MRKCSYFVDMSLQCSLPTYNRHLRFEECRFPQLSVHSLWAPTSWDLGTCMGQNLTLWMWVTVMWLDLLEVALAEPIPGAWTGFLECIPCGGIPCSALIHRGGPLSCLNLVCQTLLTPQGRPFLLWGVDGEDTERGEVGGEREGERGRTRIGMQFFKLNLLKGFKECHRLPYFSKLHSTWHIDNNINDYDNDNTTHNTSNSFHCTIIWILLNVFVCNVLLQPITTTSERFAFIIIV